MGIRVNIFKKLPGGGVFFWLKPGGYYLLVLSNIDFLRSGVPFAVVNVRDSCSSLVVFLSAD